MADPEAARTFVYVGPWKTGSTSVRSVLRAHARTPRLDGVDVPMDDASGHSWLVAAPSAGGGSSPEARFVASLYPADTDWHRLRRAEAARVSGPARATLILSEFLHLVRDPASAFEPLGTAGRTVVCCARNQVDVAASLVAELVREPGLSRDEAAAFALEFDLDYERFEALWRSARFAVSFVPYSGDVVGGVLAAMSLSHVGFGGPGARENDRVPHEAVAYLYSRKAEHAYDPAWASVCGRFCDAAKDLRRRFVPCPLLPPDAAAILKGRSTRTNALVAERHPGLSGALAPNDVEDSGGMRPRTRALCDRLFEAALDSVPRPPR